MAHRRRAFTVAELLVTTVLVALLLTLVLPAVHGAHLRAVQANGKNNLKQLALALHNAHDTYNKMPPAVGTFAGKSASIHFHLLPFLEQQNVWKAEAVETVIPGFVDPGDASAPNGNKFQDQSPTANYVANWLVFKHGAQGGAKLQNIPDGTSNTIVFAERYQVCNGTPMIWSYDQLYYRAPIFAFYSQGRFQVAPRQEVCDPALPQSLGKDGILVAMADGVARTVAPSVSATTWFRACHPADGHPLGEDWDN